MRRTFGALAAATLGVALAACSGTASQTQGGSPILLGGSISYTGVYSADATYDLQGIQLAVQDVNSQGGVLGRQLKFTYYDDTSDAGTAVRLYDKLLTEDKVNFLIGPYSSGITQAMASIPNKYQVVSVDAGASLATIFKAPNQYNFSDIATSDTYIDQVLPIAQQHGFTKAALLIYNSAFSVACGQARRAQAQQLGIQIVYENTYGLPLPDFSSQALGVKSSGAQVIVGCTYNNDSIGLAQALSRIGYKPQIFAETIGPPEASYIKTLGPIANGVITNTQWWPSLNNPGNAAFVKGFKKKYNLDPDYHAAAGYSAVQILAAAIKKAGSTDQAKVRQAILAGKISTVQGTWNSDQYGLPLGIKNYLAQYQNGTMKLVYPANLAEAPVQVPYTGT